MNSKSRRLVLNLFLIPAGHAESAWRSPNVDPVGCTDIDEYLKHCKLAERGRFDAVFLADRLSLNANPARRPVNSYDPVEVASVIASHTSRIGIVPTLSTTFNEPYNVARRLATLDHISRGRAGWNVVTSNSTDSARNFGSATLPPRDDRYERAAEFIEVCRKLWRSWGNDPIVGDQGNGIWAKSEQIRAIDHRGHYFDVKGPLNVKPSPQTDPVIFQAGSSPAGQQFAARHAEVVFTVQNHIRSARHFYRAIKACAANLDREPDSLKVLPGLVPIVAETSGAAEQKLRDLQDSVIQEHAIREVISILGSPAEQLRLNEPLNVTEAICNYEVGSRAARLMDYASHSGSTIQDLAHFWAVGRGHLVLVGTAQYICDVMLLWLNSNAADGFNIMPPIMNGDLDLFVEHVIPLLQHSGSFPTAYSGRTFRDHLNS